NSTNVRVDQFRNNRPQNTVPADSNCSLCAAAGAIMNATGRFTSSGDIATENTPVLSGTARLHNDFAGVMPAFQHNQVFMRKAALVSGGVGGLSNVDSVNDGVAHKMAAYVSQKIGCQYEIHKSNRNAVLTWMNGKMANCIFTFLTGGHW